MLIYIHIPFCKRKCKYCNFCSTTDGDVERYLRALKTEITGSDISGNIQTVYFGGGTPSVLRDGALDEILKCLDDKFGLDKNAEITAEGNPESLTEYKLKSWQSEGINRVSIGVQSLNDKTLVGIGRLHDSETAVRCVTNACKIFENVSCDLIAGLPEQNCEDVRNAVLLLTNIGIKHLSCYGLQLEEGTMLFREVQKNGLILPDEQQAADQFDTAFSAAESVGFSRYEVSNFALDGYACKHNIGYWKRLDYRGFGTAAHSLLGNVRSWNSSSVTEYISMVESNGSATVGSETLDKNATSFETIMLSLRLAEGLNVQSFEKQFSVCFSEQYGEVLKKYAECFAREGDFLKLTRRGFEILNMILVDILETS